MLNPKQQTWRRSFEDALGMLRPDLTRSPKLLAAISALEWEHHSYLLPPEEAAQRYHLARSDDPPPPMPARQRRRG